MRRFVSAFFFVAVLGLSWASQLHHPSAAAAQTDAERTRARAAYTEGQRRFDAGDFAGALAKFEEAYAIVSNPVVLLGVASAQERLGRAEDARATLERYLRERPDAPDRADVEARVVAMGGSVGAPAPATLVITSDPPGAVVVLDGESSGAVTPAEVSVSAGEHEVSVALSGYELATETVTVAAGARSEVTLSLTVIPEADEMTEDEAFEDEEADDEAAVDDAPAEAPGPSAATWVTTAIAAVALVTGTVFGFVALSRQSDFDVAPSRTLADEGGAFALGADLAFGVAVAAGITAIVLYATDRPSPAADSTAEADDTANLAPSFMVAPMISPSGGGVAAAVSF